MNHFLKLLSTVLLLAIVSTGLINNDTFYNSTTFAYYSFCSATFLFTIIVSFFYSTTDNSVNLKAPLLLFTIWCLYIVINYFTNGGMFTFIIYAIALCFLLLTSIVIFKSPNFSPKLFFMGLAIIAFTESIYCISQFLGWTKSQNQLFTTTGSWNNPNVTAIFLALSTPAFFYLLKKGAFKKIIASGLLILLISLLLLKCRSAFIGTILSAMVFYGLEYDCIGWIKNKKNRNTGKAIVILFLLVSIPVSSYLYNTKKASSDGRKFIWKLSGQMVTDRPLMGYGYGLFEKEYNLYQANYINSGQATPENIDNAGPVIMPHNEFLLNAVEGGVLGLFLMILFFVSLLLPIRNQTSLQNIPNDEKLAETINKSFLSNDIVNLSYAGIIGFTAMSMINSTMQIVPIMCLLMIYAAIICSSLKPIHLPAYFSFSKDGRILPILAKTVTVTGSIYLLYAIVNLAVADSCNKKAALLKKEKKYEQALRLMPDLVKKIGDFPDYWKNYANIYIEIQEYSKALDCFEKAKKWSSLPPLYMGSGFCNEKLNQYPKAVKDYETLVALYPSKFSYRMFLLTAYLKNRNIDKAIFLAQEIIQIKPKIPSEKTDQYKNICYGLLKQLVAQKNNKQLLLKNPIQ